MKKFLEMSITTLPWLMMIMAGLTLITMMIVLYHKREEDQKLNRKK